MFIFVLKTSSRKSIGQNYRKRGGHLLLSFDIFWDLAVTGKIESNVGFSLSYQSVLTPHLRNEKSPYSFLLEVYNRLIGILLFYAKCSEKEIKGNLPDRA